MEWGELILCATEDCVAQTCAAPTMHHTHDTNPSATTATSLHNEENTNNKDNSNDDDDAEEVQRALRTRVGLLQGAEDVSDTAIILHVYALLNALATMYGDDVAALPAMLSEPFCALETLLIGGGVIRPMTWAAASPPNSTELPSRTRLNVPAETMGETQAQLASPSKDTLGSNNRRRSGGDAVHHMLASADEAKTHMSPACHVIQRVHAATAQRLGALASAAQSRRAPLAMRSFRPRPIRLFEPLLAEGERAALARENRTVARTRREDNKREVRRRTAEATVHRRAKENEANHVAAHRERVYHQLMGQLQQQQHIMKTVDTIQARAKAGKRSGVSGAPKQAEGGRGGDDIPVY